jgi:hypothetical protein
MDVDTTGQLTQWSDQQKQRLIKRPIVGYAPGESAMAEPIAMAAITACGYQLREPAEAACRRLLKAQNNDGSISVRLNDSGPFWTTSLAAIAWRRFERIWPEVAKTAQSGSWCKDAYRRAIDFLTSFRGEVIPPTATFGHDTQLVGWPWVEGTHSWLEPTAMALMAMRQCGFAKHPRAVEAAKLLLDRQIPGGGANYGNTFVLGQKLRPHVMPSGMCLVALHRFKPQSDAYEATIDYLLGEVQKPIAAISLSWAIQALAADTMEFDRSKVQDDGRFQWETSPLAAVKRSNASRKDPQRFNARDAILWSAVERQEVLGENPHRQNLLMLAALGPNSPLLDLPYHSLPTGQRGSP